MLRLNSKIDLSALLARKRALIFDFDGTVADTAPLHERAFRETLAPFEVTVDYTSIAGLKTMDAVVRCLRAAGRSELDFDLPTLVAEKQRRARELIARGIMPIPQVGRFLLWARPLFRLSLVTSGSRGTVALALRKLGYDGWFDPIVCADDVARAKPAPDGFLKALAATGVGREEALVFEDAESGFEAARAAGLIVVDVRSLEWSIATAPCGFTP